LEEADHVYVNIFKRRFNYKRNSRLSNVGCVEANDPDYFDDEDGSFEKLAILLETSSNYARIRSEQNSKEHFAYNNNGFELNCPEKDNHYFPLGFDWLHTARRNMMLL